MDVEITPEPSEQERQAILLVLAEERGQSEEPSPWLRQGQSPDEDQAGALPRQSRGATRA